MLADPQLMAALKNRAVAKGRRGEGQFLSKLQFGEHGHGDRDGNSIALPQDALVETREADEFSALLKQSFKPRTERAATEVENAVNTLVEQALADTSLIKSDVLDTIEEMIAQFDKKLSAQMNEIMHAPEFQQIESAWRGLYYLIFQSETDAMLKISRHERLEERALPASAAISQRRLGPEPTVQEGLRRGVRTARRTALWLPDRRLLFQPPAGRTCSCCAISAGSPAPRTRRSSPPRIPP